MPQADNLIKAVLFDLGDTLVNFGKVDTRRIFRDGATLSYEYLASLHQPLGSFENYYRKNLLSIHLRCCFSAIIKRDFNSLALLKKIGTKKGLRLDDSQWCHLEWLWYQPLARAAHVEPNIEQTLTELRQSGLKLAIASNTFISAASLEKHLQQLGILDFFTVRLYSYQFPFRKPDVRIFTSAAEKIGEKFENILSVGDRIRNDIVPAKKIGMPAVLKSAYTNDGRKIPDGVWKICRLAELPALIEKINAQSRCAAGGA